MIELLNLSISTGKSRKTRDSAFPLLVTLAIISRTFLVWICWLANLNFWFIHYVEHPKLGGTCCSGGLHQTLSWMVRGLVIKGLVGLCSDAISLDENVYSILSLCGKLYKWVAVTNCWGEKLPPGR